MAEQVFSELDRRILTETQSGFPVASRPYAELAGRLGSTEAVVFDAVVRLRRLWVIRRIGASFDSLRLSWTSTLGAMKVPAGGIGQAADVLAALPEVTHAQLRDDPFDLWFTVVAPSRERVATTLAYIGERCGVETVLDLPALRLFKIRIDFDFTGAPVRRTEAPATVEASAIEPVTLSADERALAALVERDIPTTVTPFADLADRLKAAGVDHDEAWVLERTRAWLAAGVLRRFGAVVRHPDVARVNAMAVWPCPPSRILEAGRAVASFGEVAQCYERPTFAEWPYALHATMFSDSREEAAAAAARITDEAGLDAPRLLFETRELKKTSMSFFGE